MRFLISAGEASGETYGAQLITALRERVSEIDFYGVGGQAMRAAGCKITVDAAEIAVVGLFEVIRHLPYIFGRFKRLVGAIDQSKPDAAILIDFPDFNFRLARELHRRNIPVFYYVSPQLWAWRSRRIKLVRRYVRSMLVIFPFEEEWYRRRGVDVTYVGHPLAHVPAPTISRTDFAQRYGLDPDRQWIALLPGSRRKELSMNLPVMLEAARRVRQSYQFILPVASTLDAGWVQGLVKNTSIPLSLTTDAGATLFHARAAVVASGTATVEAALLGTPFVMVYRVAPLSWALGKHLVHVPFYGMVNLIAGREVVPELVQHDFTPDRVAGELEAILPDGLSRERMLVELASVRKALERGHQGQTAAARAAEVILESLGRGAGAASSAPASRS
jgi:lipid-A-disaccharide synthase